MKIIEALKELERAVQYRIADILGGSYRAQEELLQPIVEYLVNVEGLTRHEVYLAFKDAEFSSYGWFLEWSYGRAFLEADINKICKIFNLDPKSGWKAIEPYLGSIERYYVGIPESKWLQWVFESRVIYEDDSSAPNTVQEETKIGDRKIKAIYKILMNKHGVNSLRDLRYKLHRERAIKVLEKGYFERPSEDDPNFLIKEVIDEYNYHLLICKYIFKLSYYGSKHSASKKYFEQNLFKGLDFEDIWRVYYRGGDNYLD